MNDEQMHMVKALRKCQFMPGSFEKRFVADMTYHDIAKSLSPRQDWFLRRTYWRYRKQIGHGGEKPHDFDSPPPAPVKPVSGNDVEYVDKGGVFVCYAPPSVAHVAAEELDRLKAWNAGQPRKVTP